MNNIKTNLNLVTKTVYQETINYTQKNMVILIKN